MRCQGKNFAWLRSAWVIRKEKGRRQAVYTSAAKRYQSFVGRRRPPS